MVKKIILVLSIWACAYTLQAQQIKKVKITDVVALADTSTAPLIINFWATWCPPCVHEMPYFISLAKAYKDKGVKIVFVSLDFADDYPKGIQRFMKKMGFEGEVWWLDETDPNYFTAKFDKKWGASIPVSTFINKAKQYRQFYNGQLTEPQLKIAIEKMLQ